MTEWPRSWGYTQAEEEINAQSRGEQPGKTNHSAGVWREIEFIKFAEMRPRLDGRPLIKGMIEREQTSLIFGESGSGKTFLALDRDLHIAAGLDWFGRKVTQGGVVYVAAEAGRSIANRVVAWRDVHGLAYKDLPFAAITSPVDLCHREAGDIDRLIELIQSASLGPLALVEIDTVSRALAGGNENAPDDMGALVHSIDRVRDEMHCHVSAVHHVGKEANKGSRGHSLLHCAVDTEIEVIHHDATGISIATVTKQRDGATEGEVRFRLRQIELGRNQDDDPVTSCIVEPLGAGEAAAKKPPGKLPDSAKLGLEQLRNCIAQNVTVIPSSNHVPSGATGVRLELWKSYLLKAGIINEHGNPREQFKRIYVMLQARGYIGIWDRYVMAFDLGVTPSHGVTYLSHSLHSDGVCSVTCVTHPL